MLGAMKEYSNSPNKTELSISRSQFKFFNTKDQLPKSSRLIPCLVDRSSRDLSFYFCNLMYHKSRIINKLNPNDRKYSNLHNKIGYGIENNMYDVYHRLNQLFGLVRWFDNV